MTDKPVLPNQNKVEKTDGMGKKHDADIKNPNWTANTNKEFSKDATKQQSPAKGIDKNQAGSANMNNSKLDKKP